MFVFREASLLTLLLWLFISNLNGKKAVNVVKKAKREPNFNSSYYKEPFRPCKKFETLNPVEQVRAQAYATKVFANCGPKVIVRNAQRINLPASGTFGSLRPFMGLRDCQDVDPMPVLSSGPLTDGIAPSISRLIQRITCSTIV